MINWLQFRFIFLFNQMINEFAGVYINKFSVNTLGSCRVVGRLAIGILRLDLFYFELI